MKVRTQLVVAFLVLAVLPLTGIVLYSYAMSQRAFRKAVADEATGISQEMGRRLTEVRQDLVERVDALADLQVRDLLPGQGGGGAAGQVYSELMERLGEAAVLVDSFEFEPVAGERGEVGGGPETFYIYPSKTLAEALAKLRERQMGLEESGLPQAYMEATIREAVRLRDLLEAAEIEALAARDAEMKRLLGTELTRPVFQGGDVVGYLKALVPASRILNQVLERTPRDEGDVPYALDTEGNLYVDSSADRELLESLEIGIAWEEVSVTSRRGREDWLIVETPDTDSELIFGIARPIRESLQEIQRTAVRNFGYGLGMVVLSLAGVLWLSGRMTRKLSLLTDEAERLAGGDFDARVHVVSRDEFGQLAKTFNRMAGELSEKQRLLVEEARMRKEQEIQSRLLEAENERKSRELEEARQLQLSLLPQGLPEHPSLEIAVFMRTATEVGGDYYDFFPASDGTLTTAIGDAAGHGAKAGTMVTVVKGLLSVAAGEARLPTILDEANRAIRRMNLGRMNMAAALVRIRDSHMTVSMAGMPPALIYRGDSGRVEEVALSGTPLGSMGGTSYLEWESPIGPGDTLLLMSDGFPELLSVEGEVLGYSRARERFEEAASASPDEIVAHLAASLVDWNGGRPPEDDVTFVVLKAR